MKIELCDAANRIQMSRENDKLLELPSDEDEPSGVEGEVFDPVPEGTVVLSSGDPAGESDGEAALHWLMAGV